MVIFTIFFSSSNICKSGNSCNHLLETAKFFAFITFSITWFCTGGSIMKSGREEDANQKVPKKHPLQKKSGAVLPLSSLCFVGLSRSCPALQLPGSGPCFHVPWQKCQPSFFHLLSGAL